MTKDVTILAIDFGTHELTKLAIEQTLTCIDPKEIIVISDKNIYPGSTWVPCKPVRNYLMYNELMLKWTYPLIETGHALYVQYDGLAINKSIWTDDFLKYDYIGATWPHLPENMNVGNGGFSLRSKKFLDACRDPTIQITDGTKWVGNEDHVTGVLHRRLLEHKYSIKFASTNVARKFSYETGEYRGPTFGIHGYHNLVAAVSYYEYVLENLNYSNWNAEKWINLLASLAHNNRLNNPKFLIEMINKHSPEHINSIVETLKQNLDKVSNFSNLLECLT